MGPNTNARRCAALAVTAVVFSWACATVALAADTGGAPGGGPPVQSQDPVRIVGSVEIDTNGDGHSDVVLDPCRHCAIRIDGGIVEVCDATGNCEEFNVEPGGSVVIRGDDGSKQKKWQRHRSSGGWTLFIWDPRTRRWVAVTDQGGSGGSPHHQRLYMSPDLDAGPELDAFGPVDPLDDWGAPAFPDANADDEWDEIDPVGVAGSWDLDERASTAGGVLTRYWDFDGDGLADFAQVWRASDRVWDSLVALPRAQ